MRSPAIILLAGFLAGAVPPAGAEVKPGDAERGRVVFNQCVVCHSSSPQDVPNPGPDLRGMVGRPAGSVPGFRYSRALRRSGLRWDESTLDRFLADPQALVPGNTMPYPGEADPAARAALVAYLKTLQPAPL